MTLLRALILSSTVLASACAPGPVPVATRMVDMGCVNKAQEVGRYDFEGTLSFKGSGYDTKVKATATDGSGNAWVTNWPGLPSTTGKFDPATKYRITIVANKWDEKKRSRFQNALFILKISRDGKSVYDAGTSLYDDWTCKVHGVAMDRRVEDLRDGGTRLPDSYFSLRDRSFPNSGIFHPLCGSVGQLTWHCPDCETAEERWEKRHGFR